MVGRFSYFKRNDRMVEDGLLLDTFSVVHDVYNFYRFNIFSSKNLEQCMASNISLECQYNGVNKIKERTPFDIGRIWFPRLVDWTLPKFCDYHKCK